MSRNSDAGLAYGISLSGEVLRRAEGRANHSHEQLHRSCRELRGDQQSRESDVSLFSGEREPTPDAGRPVQDHRENA